MAETFALAAENRTVRGSRRMRRMREAGKLPAVVYGHKEKAVALTISMDDFQRALRQGTRLVELQTEGKSETALVRDIQWDPFGQHVLHVDFTRVSRTEMVQIEVALEIKGTAPGTLTGGILDQPMHTLQIECSAINMPDAIIVNVNELQLEQAIHVKDLRLPEGVAALDDADAIVVHVIQPVAEEEEAEEAESAEPELVKRGKEEEAEDAES